MLVMHPPKLVPLAVLSYLCTYFFIVSTQRLHMLFPLSMLPHAGRSSIILFYIWKGNLFVMNDLPPSALFVLIEFLSRKQRQFKRRNGSAEEQSLYMLFFPIPSSSRQPVPE